mmetsp:Transcript_49287/g.123540  ORF Transcript_49287/g.123540 Transcript_49287/m.123540 type:complete len:282 (-) Transcript_49287:411-1256(-)
MGVFREDGEVDLELVEAFFHPGVEQDGFRAVETPLTLHALSVIGVLDVSCVAEAVFLRLRTGQGGELLVAAGGARRRTSVFLVGTLLAQRAFAFAHCLVPLVALADHGSLLRRHSARGTVLACLGADLSVGEGVGSALGAVGADALVAAHTPTELLRVEGVVDLNLVENGAELGAFVLVLLAFDVTHQVALWIGHQGLRSAHPAEVLSQILTFLDIHVGDRVKPQVGVLGEAGVLDMEHFPTAVAASNRHEGVIVEIGVVELFQPHAPRVDGRDAVVPHVH